MRSKLIILLCLGAVWGSSCSDFLEETPNKSGSAYISYMDQLYGMAGSPDLYLLDAPEGTSVGAYQAETLPMSDAVEYTPEYYVEGLWSSYPEVYERYCWKGDALKQEAAMLSTWTPAWERIYRFNTILEYLDKVEQSTEDIRHQVEGEALFGRAYYHFMLLTQYSLWGDDKPGIGYRDGASTLDPIPARQTVAYTLSRIYQDLDNAEKALAAAGRTNFDQEHNYRPTVPTVQAFRARVALYRGDYDTALKNATAALEAHHTLVDFKNDPTYELYPYMDIYLMDETGTEAEEIVSIYSMDELAALGNEAVAEYEEAYLPNVMTESYEAEHPISEAFYKLWDRENDARWIHFYSACKPLQMAEMLFDIQEVDGEEVYAIAHDVWTRLKPWNFYNYMRFSDEYGIESHTVIGMTTAEMYLIKAECEARSGDAGAAAETLKTLRRTRFMSDEAAEQGVTGSVQEVLDERQREMGVFWRFFDIKRLNGAEQAGITIRREILTEPTDLDSRTVLEIAPDDPRWALPIYPVEIVAMDWAQNEGW